MAVDVGEVEARGGDLLRPVMNRAGRMLAAAHGGQVLSPTRTPRCRRRGAAGRRRRSASSGSRHRQPAARLPAPADGLATSPLRIDRSPPPIPVGAFGRSVRGHELREQVGSGDVGVVYRIYQPSVGREVAIKVIRPELVNRPAFVRGFESEARLVAQLEHPHLVPLYDYWRTRRAPTS